MNAQQLKNSILQEAIEGRLVKQDPNDEPASVLLERIRAEKKMLVKEGKLKKKDLEEIPISEDEIPFTAPKGWVWKRLSDIALDSADGPFGSNLKREHYTNEKEVRIIQLSNIGEDGWVDKNTKYTTFEHLKIISRSEAFAGDIIIAKMMPAGRAIICPSNDTKYVLSSDAVRFDFYKEIDRKFLYYAINSKVFLNQVYSEVQGITRVRTSLSKLRNYFLPIPPLAEQKRIVAKIEELLPKVDEYGKAQESLDKLNAELPEKLKKSILQEAIEGRLVPQDKSEEPASVLLERIRAEKKRLLKEKKIKKSALKEEPLSDDDKLFSIPYTWEWCKLGWIGDWGAGATPAKGTAEFYANGTIPWLRTGELNNGIVYDSDIKVTPYALQKCSLRECQIGDVLIAMYGATIGKVAIAGIELTTNQACCACTPYLVYNKYLLYYLLASKQRFIDLGEGGAQPNISREKIVAFPFPLPPLSEQHRIVQKIEELFKEIDKLKA